MASLTCSDDCALECSPAFLARPYQDANSKGVAPPLEVLGRSRSLTDTILLLDDNVQSAIATAIPNVETSCGLHTLRDSPAVRDAARDQHATNNSALPKGQFAVHLVRECAELNPILFLHVLVLRVHILFRPTTEVSIPLGTNSHRSPRLMRNASFATATACSKKMFIQKLELSDSAVIMDRQCRNRATSSACPFCAVAGSSC